jgi:hypothetical protein
LRYFVNVFNGWCWFVNLGRDTDATWRSLSTLCRERGWSMRRAIYELQNGLPYRTFPPGHTINWHMVVAQTFDPDAVTIVVDGPEVLNTVTVAVEVMPPAPTDADEVPAAVASAQWAFDTTHHLLAKNRIPKGITQAKLASLLEIEAQKAVKTGQIRRALKASYLENQLSNWGIWPLKSSK